MTTFVYTPTALFAVTETEIITESITTTTAANPGIQRSLSDLIHRLQLKTLDDCSLLVLTKYARQFATTDEVFAYLYRCHNSAFTLDPNRGYGLPDYIYGIKIVITPAIELLPFAN